MVGTLCLDYVNDLKGDRLGLEIEFAGSEIEEIIVSPKLLEIRFAYFVVLQKGEIVQDGKQDSEHRQVPGSLKVIEPKYKSLPGKGLLSDGELYGIAGKALNGRLPINFRADRGIELVLEDAKGEHSIQGKGFELVMVRLELN